MEPKIEVFTSKKLVGLRMLMSLANNKTAELWQTFMRRRREIGNSLGNDLYSVNLYPSDYYTQFHPAREFEKWAAIEVSDFEHVPERMESMELPEGLYAVFLHKGGPGTGPQTFQFIFGTWLPYSGYQLDDRPYFEILGKKYKNDDPESEEEIWVPLRRKEE